MDNGLPVHTTARVQTITEAELFLPTATALESIQSTRNVWWTILCEFSDEYMGGGGGEIGRNKLVTQIICGGLELYTPKLLSAVGLPFSNIQQKRGVVDPS